MSLEARVVSAKSATMTFPARFSVAFVFLLAGMASAVPFNQRINLADFLIKEEDPFPTHPFPYATHESSHDDGIFSYLSTASEEKKTKTKVVEDVESGK